MPISFPFGRGQATLLNIGHLQARLSDWLPVPAVELQQPSLRPYQADYHRPLHFPMQVLLVRLAHTTILADPMRYSDLLGTEFAIAGYAPPPSLAQQLASLGLDTAAVEHVVISHAHFDHYGAVLDSSGGLQFPNAHHYLGAGDWHAPWLQRALRDPDSLAATALGRLRAAGLLELVSADRPIARGIQLWLTPGETDGHLVLRIQAGDATLFYLGDLIHHPLEVARTDIVPPWSEPRLLHSRQRVFAAALEGQARLVASHIGGVGRLDQTANGYRWRSIAADPKTATADPDVT